MIRIYDYRSGVKLGTEEINWMNYQLWKQGPSEICEAKRILTQDQISRLDIQPDTTVFCFDENE